MKPTLRYTLSHQKAIPAQTALVTSVINELQHLPLLDHTKVPLPAHVVISIVLVTAPAMKELNTDYRKKPSSTDVLSFQYGEPTLFGELYLSLDDIKKNAAAFSEGDTGRELAEIIIHGTLHLLGHTHGSKMFAIQRKYASLWYESHSRTG